MTLFKQTKFLKLPLTSDDGDNDVIVIGVFRPPNQENVNATLKGNISKLHVK